LNGPIGVQFNVLDVEEVGFDHVSEDVGFRDIANSDGGAITTLTRCECILDEEGDCAKDNESRKHLHDQDWCMNKDRDEDDQNSKTTIR
jgi:hypothetical protein